MSSLNCDGWQWLNLESLNHCRRRQRETDVLGRAMAPPPPMGRGHVRAGLVAHGGPTGVLGEPACRVGRPAKVAQHSETIW